MSENDEPSSTDASEPSGDAPNENSGRQAAIAFILLTLFIDILGLGIVIPVLPELVQELIDGNESEASLYVGIISAAYALMQFLFAPIVGALSDRFGRRPIILASLFGLGIDFLIQGFAPNIWWLLFGRALAGVMGASFTTANAYIADVSTDETRARNFGFVGMMFGLGFTLGPGIGALLGLLDLGGFERRLPFFVAAALALVNWLYGYFILPESLPPEKRSAFSLAHGNPFGTIKQLKAYPFVAGLAAVFVCKSLAQRGLENVWVLHNGYKFDWGEFENGMSLVWVGITAIIVQGGMVRPFCKRFGERKALIIATVIAAIAFFGYGMATEGWMMYAIITFGALGGIAGPAIQSLVTSTVAEDEQGKIQGSITSLVSLTNIIAPLLFTAGLFRFFTSDVAPFKLPGAPFLVGGVLIVIALFIIRRVFRKFPEQD